MSLRVRMLLGLLVVALVLVAADFLVASSVNRTLVGQVDRRVVSAVTRVARGGPEGAGIARPRTGTPTTTPSPGTGTLSELFVTFLGPGGSVVSEIPPGLRSESPPKVDPATLVAHATNPGAPVNVFTTAGSGGGSRFRVAVVRTSGQSGFAMVGVSLRESDATNDHLLVVLGLATAAVIAVLGLVAFWIVRLGIRPIDRMAATADAIAAGDVSRRVETRSERTEVGRLGAALNAMLHQIEAAFAQRGASEQRLRRFVADASHELRTPLTSIRGYVELYRSGAIEPGPALDDAMRRVEAESVRMSVLVDELLQLARLDQGPPTDRRATDLGAVVSDAVTDARAVEPDRPITLDVPDEPVWLLADPLGLHQAVANLLANTRAHTPPGSPVEVRVHTSGAVARVEVADQGHGIAPEHMERLFERFYRGDPARAHVGSGGSGLGLSIVAAVAEAHGGRAWADNGPSGGSRFTIELPLADAPADH